MTTPDLTEVTILRAIGALPDDEARAFDDALDNHPERRTELAGYHEVLALLTEEEEPAAGLLPGLLAALHPPEPAGESTVISMDPAKRDRTRRLGIAAMAVAAAAIAVVLIGSLFLGDSGSDPTLDELAAAALDEPGADVVTLDDADGATVGEAAVQPGGSGFVIVDGLGDPGSNEVFQLWQLSEGEPVSIGFLGADGVAAIQLGPGATGLAVSVEDEDGAVTPTAGRIVATGELA